MTKTLSQINRDLEDLLSKIDEFEENSETPPAELIDLLKATVSEEGDKIDRCCMFINSAQGQIEVFKEHIKTVQGEIKKLDRAIERLKYVAGLTMESRGIRSLSGNLGHKFSLRQSAYVEITDEASLPESVLKVSYSADKSLIKEWIKQGKDISGAHIQTRDSVVVK